jgi:hypothetical protein
MAIDTTSPRTRRALLGGAFGGAIALVAGALARPLSGRAADGDVIHVGDQLTGTRPTGITSPVADLPVSTVEGHAPTPSRAW